MESNISNLDEIHIVRGEIIYGETRSWAVKAFLSEEEALSFAKDLNERYITLGGLSMDFDPMAINHDAVYNAWKDSKESRSKTMRELDPCFTEYEYVYRTSRGTIRGGNCVEYYVESTPIFSYRNSSLSRSDI